MKNIFIGGAWPYANNSLHIGHFAALLPGDVLARFFRKNGNQVLYVSGSDCHGTPITVRANKLGVNAKDIASHYDNEFRKNFEDLEFSYDLYTNTMTKEHENVVKNNLKIINNKGLFYTKTEKEDYCENCGKFISDREIKGICPICGAEADGDQCDKCLTTLTPSELKDKTCKLCGHKTVLKDNTHLYFKLSGCEQKVTDLFEKYKKYWRPTTVNETAKYLKEGLRDRAITRSLNWGIELPFDGFDDKRVYVWIEAVMGYLSAGEQAAKNLGINFEDFMHDKNTTSYYVHGKDNIVFHTIILPALLGAIDENISMPERIIASEYVNMGGDKMSKSKGNLITVNTLLANFDPDSIRYYFCLNNPEKRDMNFDLADYISIHNKHLVGGYGNFVNRNLSFLAKKFEGKLPALNLDAEVKTVVEKTYKEIKELFINGEIKEATTKLYDYVQYANKYYDTNEPWVLAKTDLEKFNKVTSNCLYLIANMANLYEPIMPKRTKIVSELLGFNSNNFEPVVYDANKTVCNVPLLFQRIEEDKVDMTKGAEATFQS
ncbi:MAG: methionine--tRNA ligase [Clostridiales bacterium]|nr:methionine--tRNA ligase [Clostridiales bacterium]